MPLDEAKKAPTNIHALMLSTIIVEAENRGIELKTELAKAQSRFRYNAEIHAKNKVLLPSGAVSLEEYEESEAEEDISRKEVDLFDMKLKENALDVQILETQRKWEEDHQTAFFDESKELHKKRWVIRDEIAKKRSQICQSQYRYRGLRLARVEKLYVSKAVSHVELLKERSLFAQTADQCKYQHEIIDNIESALKN